MIAFSPKYIDIRFPIAEFMLVANEQTEMMFVIDNKLHSYTLELCVAYLVSITTASLFTLYKQNFRFSKPAKGHAL